MAGEDLPSIVVTPPKETAPGVAPGRREEEEGGRIPVINNQDDEPMIVEEDSFEMLLSELEKEFGVFEDLSNKMDSVNIGGAEKGEVTREFALIVIADFKVKKERFYYKGRLIRWIVVSCKNLPIGFLGTHLLKLLTDPTPKRIVMACWGQYVGVKHQNDIMDAIRRIKNKTA